MKQSLLPCLLGLSSLGFLSLMLPLVMGMRAKERSVNGLVAVVMTLHLALSLGIGLSLAVDRKPLSWDLGAWFQGGIHPFLLEFYVDRMSAALLASASFIACIVGVFSARYLHRDPGFHRFSALFLLFIGAITLVLSAANFDVLLIGWELLGLSSVLLIGFFQFRAAPPAGSLYALVTYRICDASLTAAMLLFVRWAHVTHIPVGFPSLSYLPPAAVSEIPFVGLLLILGCMGKSAQLPFSSWLPRAMEGPTPSSAVFYGAVTAHMGAYLLLRVAPLWRLFGPLHWMVVAVGVCTALYAAFCGRTRADAKTQLAFAAMAQLGLIFVEIGLGWDTLALCHMIGHSFLRTLQFLKAPSLLHEFQKMGMTGKRFFRNSLFLVEKIMPASVQEWLYRHAFHEAHLPALVSRCVVAPYYKTFRTLDRLEKTWASLFEGGDKGRPVVERTHGMAS